MIMAARKSPQDATRRELIVTAANIRHNHVYIAGHHDFFPAECIGPVRRSKASTTPQIALHLDGLDQTVHTDIGTNGATGKPRGQFRSRAWVQPFFKHHRITPGDRLLLERVADVSHCLTTS